MKWNLSSLFLLGTSLIGKAYKDVWSVWVRQIWLDFITKETVSGSKPKSFPFIDSTPLMLWISKTEAAIPPFAPVPIPPIKTESLPCTPSSLSCDLRKTQSEQVFPSPSDESMETCDSTTHDKDRFERNKKLLDFYRQSVEKGLKISYFICVVAWRKSVVKRTEPIETVDSGSSPGDETEGKQLVYTVSLLDARK